MCFRIGRLKSSILTDTTFILYLLNFRIFPAVDAMCRKVRGHFSFVGWTTTVCVLVSC